MRGIIFVVDSADRERMGIAKDRLRSLLLDDQLWDAPLLVIANKGDLEVRCRFAFPPSTLRQADIFE
jgi:GTPase SAR1 family protein